ETVIIGQLAAFDAAIAFELGIIFIAMGLDRNAIFKIDNQSAMGVARPAHDMFLSAESLADHISLHRLDLAGSTIAFCNLIVQLTH
ncbi:MAG: hypothetical protein ABJM44_00710, partial [Marinomonas sp.]